MFSLSRKDVTTLAIFSVIVLTMPIWLSPLGAAYPGLMQKFAIYAIFAIGFNILFGLTGYLSFGHAAFLGVGSYTAVWSFKLLSMDMIPALIFAVIFAGIFALFIGYFSLRRSGIYFSILTLAFAQMSYSLAYSVLTPITNGETGLLIARDDPRAIDALLGVNQTTSGMPTPSLLGFDLGGYGGFYICAVVS
ncbi:MAG: branched-chain amino acid ABC transporter permease, partial [Ruegeria sp.]|nr:branched-chain amino acid ABC transporter permease [Ruegeria sp.]